MTLRHSLKHSALATIGCRVLENQGFSAIQTLISITKEIAALVLAIAPKEQSNGTCAVICRRALARGDQRRETYPGEERALQNTFVWTSPEFQPLESGDFFIVP